MEAIFSRIISDKNAFFKHQQMNEEELTEDEKMEILKTLSKEKLPVFLSRYQKYLEPVDGQIFADNDDFVVQSIMKQIRGQQKMTEKEKRNYRFNAMQNLLKEGEFFSDAKMREREPYLFDAMIGKFLNDEERMDHLRPTVSRDKSESTWSTLMDRLEDSTEIAERRNLQEREWEGSRDLDDGGRDHINRFMSHVDSHAENFVPEEEEGDEESTEKVEDEIETMRKEMERLSKIEAEQYDDLDENETQQVLRREFEAFMQQKFLAGKDKEFYDYSKCEEFGLSNPIKERDDEERWFEKDD
ncbi:CCD97-like C-terminal domain-containing protein [Caenorhabditis elegans]|uniref:CCD97-like C-terminal domain-containing protein n=2 Tax=Caenorhabditis elegans TaxID=6239 RepID=Q9XVJ7_CAEEL|nr:CCD97-like C-terminal domain-containing protein [Caenorhabditis elegans]CAB03248.2 CCD97-like C-terminal domain-containing protein [Caenorhabditis elegans]|eukprot:NP_506469.2 Uncharacterized protein CELE_R10D12.13 [Caenorhabditis elegans]